jgi:hypothetical protein
LEGEGDVKEGERNPDQISVVEHLKLCYGLLLAFEGAVRIAFLHCITVLVGRCGGEEEGTLDWLGQNVPKQIERQNGV